MSQSPTHRGPDYSVNCNLCRVTSRVSRPGMTSQLRKVHVMGNNIGLPEETIQESLELCQQICSTVSSTIQQYIDKQPSYRFFRLPESLIHGSTGTEPSSHDIAHYKAIPWFMKDMDNRQLLEEWAIYVMQILAELRPYTNEGRDSDAMEHLDICRYWKDRCASLPRLAGHALRTLEGPVSSSDAERAFSTYNKLICSSRLSLSDEFVRVLHSAAWNSDINGRFKGYDY